MSDFAKYLIKAFLRHGLTAFGALLLRHGVITEGEAASFVGDWLDIVLGALIVLVAQGWEYVYQRYVKKKVVTALELPSGASTVRLAAAMGEKK